MLLVVDVGNTQTHFGVFRSGEDDVAEHWRFATVRESRASWSPAWPLPPARSRPIDQRDPAPSFVALPVTTPV